ncbi:MAG TPA: hypothetical protein DDY04_07785 [Bacteroidales bacterium]|nr:hypothetical protein [Bacteroidales bacterium]
MKRQLRYIPILFLAISALLLITSEYGLKKVPYIKPIPTKKKTIESVFEKKVNIALEQSKKLLQDIDTSCNSSSFQRCLNYISSLSAKDRFEIFIYKKDRLCFWSTQNEPDEGSPKKNVAELIKINSAYFVSLWNYNVDSTISARILIHVSNEYPYQNKYLTNEYVGDFKILSGFSISRQLESFCIPIRPKNFEPFYLVPTNVSGTAVKDNIKTTLRYVSLILLLISFVIILNRNTKKVHPVIQVLLFTAAIILVRFVSLKTSFPGVLPIHIFNPELYAHTWYNPSLGDYLINALLALLIAAFAFRNLKEFRLNVNSIVGKMAWGFTSILMFLGYVIAHAMIVSLVSHSTIPLDTSNIFNLNFYSVIGYLSAVFWVLAAITLNLLWLRINEQTKTNHFLRFSSLLGILVLLPFYLMVDFSYNSLYGYVWFIAISGSLYWICRVKSKRIGARALLYLTAVTSIYITLTVSAYSRQKEVAVRKVLAVSLSSERDPLAEMILPQLYQTLTTDSYTRNCVKDIDNKNVELYDYLRREYFKDYLNRYDLTATVCLENSIIIDELGGKTNCFLFFDNLISSYGIILPNSRFYYLSTHSGYIYYIGVLSYRFDDEVRNLYIELNSRPSWELLGYPELLIEGKNKRNQLKGYSWAKYHEGKLVTKSGNYEYKLKVTDSDTLLGSYMVFNENSYTHLSYKPNPSDIIIISKPRQGLLSATASIAYIFIFFLILLTLYLYALGIKLSTQLTSLKHKIGWAMVSIIIISMLMVASATIYYNVKNFDDRNRSSLSEKLLSLQFELEYHLPYMNRNRQDTEFLEGKLIDLSNTFYTDINIYDTTGVLLATSRSEIFDKKLVGSMMNPIAWHQLHNMNTPKYLQQENIGKAKFLSAYVPLLNPYGKTVAYLNLPYFTRQEELQNELYDIIVAIINIFALLALLSISLVVAITSELTKPLEMIRESMSRVNITGNNATIEYSGNDEVGQLISEYNRMVIELARSAEELARSQRETAWREMAKQIAHEVKNPLTPIKLSLQHLIKSKREGLPNWDQRFEKFAQSLTEQINALTVIANEFASFAKLPSAKREPVYLVAIIYDVITLHSSYKHVQINIENTAGEPKVFADKDQLIRVFNNLIKNSIQAIEMGKSGEVNIRISATPNRMVKVDISDTGIGIPQEAVDKIFTPNFTTKSGGTGLGLAISREIILNFGGDIYFTTQENVGTTFTVELPLYEI